MLAGALIRLFFVKRHAYKLGRQPHPWPYLAASIGILTAMIVIGAPTASSTSGTPVSGRLSDVQAVMQKHCLQCHGPAVQLKNVRLDSTEELKRHAAAVYQQVVVQKAMPMSNLTQISDHERAIIAEWFKAGAPTQ